MSKVLIIGGGAAGMMAAVAAGENGHEVWLYEKNDRLGRKLFITGKGRCNITNAGDMETLFASVMSNPKFLYSSFYTFTNDQVIDFFEELGVRTKIERGNRVFPLSDHSSDVIAGLKRKLETLGVHICLETEVEKIEERDGKFQAIVLKGGQRKTGDACIVATGGISYPATGSTGDGYRFAKENGHQITKLYPALVPMEVREWYAKELQGLSLRNVSAAVYDGKKKLYEDFGEMLFTHFGVSGPLILSASSYYQTAAEKLRKKKEKQAKKAEAAAEPLENGKTKAHAYLKLDLKPALSMEQLDKRILRDFEENKNKQFKNAVDGLFPARLVPIMIQLSGIDPEKKVHEITREERKYFEECIKGLTLTIAGTRGFEEAIITRGGGRVKEVNPSTMESRLVPGLYMAGEMLDLDALTGGFNLQIAWSTGYLAGASIP